jgi:hypothetical protein
MTLTAFPNGISSFGIPVGGSLTNGKYIFVRPGTSSVCPDGFPGNDGNTGMDITTPLATLAAAHSLATANNNDVVYMIASSNTLAYTSDSLTTSLLWNKDGVHLIGLNAGNALSPRSRIGVASTATATAVAPLVTFSANDCRWQGIQVISELASASAIGGMLVSGDRNHFVGCHIAGCATDTQDVATQYSLKVTGSENLFENCVIGIDTIARGTAATYEMLFSGHATRNIFRNCMFVTFAEAAGYVFAEFGSGSIDRYALFDNCIFVNSTNSTATTMTAALTVNASAGGHVILKDCMLIGATDWTATDSSVVQLLGHTYDLTGNDVNIGIATSVDVTA